jgi:hypothetical protein
VIVRLTHPEILLAHMVAGLRITYTFQANTPNRYGANGDGAGDWLHVLGARGELAVAKAFNLYWHPAVGETKRVDVGGLYEVRTVDAAHKKLILHAADDDDRAFILADVSGCPNVLLAGWILARDGKRPEWWADPTGRNRPAFFVPRDKLLPMAELAVRR